jgi:hypothetical protein
MLTSFILISTSIILELNVNSVFLFYMFCTNHANNDLREIEKNLNRKLALMQEIREHVQLMWGIYIPWSPRLGYAL